MAALLRSPFGRTLLAIRENERRARFLGIPVDRHIWLSWVISCLFVSLAGTLYALLNNFADPHDLRWDQSGDFVIMAVLGGMRVVLGAADRRRDLRRAAGLRVEPDRELDVVHRPVLRARRAVLPARRARHHRAKERAVSLLEVENVSRRFGSLVAVDAVSMTVEPGELRAVIGPNGAGKTTFFNLISGFLAAELGPDPVRRRGYHQAAAGAAGVARHRPHLPDHRGVPRADGARKSAHRGRGRRRLSPAAVDLARGATAAVERAGDRSVRHAAASPTGRTGWSAN